MLFNGINIEDIQENLTIELMSDMSNLKVLETDNLCSCCLGNNKLWESYLLPCGHTVHTRCFRKYVSISQKCVCPICKKLEFPRKCKVCSSENTLYVCKKCVDKVTLLN